jgi:RHS repeat-associated protein
MQTVISKLKNYSNLLCYAILLSLSLTLPASAREETTVTYYHNDISGSPLAATDAAGNVVWKESYRPYGDKLRKEPASGNNTNKIGYAGSPFDAGTGLSYMGARYYDPVIGRFMGIDPVGFQEDNVHSFNRYAYANNNPYKFVDRDGREARLLAIGVGILVIGSTYYALAPPYKQQEMRESIDRLSRAIGSALHSESAEAKPTEGAKGEPQKGTGNSSDNPKPPLSDYKDALDKVHDKVGKLPKGEDGKFGSPQAGDSKKGYRLDPPHDGVAKGDAESKHHFNWWDYSRGKRGNGGESGAIPIGN